MQEKKKMLIFKKWGLEQLFLYNRLHFARLYLYLWSIFAKSQGKCKKKNEIKIRKVGPGTSFLISLWRVDLGCLSDEHADQACYQKVRFFKEFRSFCYSFWAFCYKATSLSCTIGGQKTDRHIIWLGLSYFVVMKKLMYCELCIFRNASYRPSEREEIELFEKRRLLKKLYRSRPLGDKNSLTMLNDHISYSQWI